jgi:thioesterase domain-containing protein
MEPMRRFLLQHNFTAVHWGLGRNNGDVPGLLPQVTDLVRDLAEAEGRSVALVGWSLGGYLARETARDLPEYVDEVITLGTGAWGGPKYTLAAPYYKFQGLAVDEIESNTFERYQIPIKQPVTAFYSKRDGIINWECCIDHWSPNVTHIEIDCPHMGMPVFNENICRVAEILARKSEDIPEQMRA